MDMTSMLSPEQKDILRAVAAGEYRAPDGGAKRRIQRLHQHGLVRRHDTDMMLCFPTDAGMTLARDLGLLDPVAPEPALPAATLAVEFGLVEAPKPAKVPEIVTMLETAARLFDEGDIQRARVIADGAYDLSQAEARFAQKYAATRELVPKFRQLQGDALLMETRCKIQLAKAYDAAQEAGQAAKKGRPKNVATDDIFKQAEAGLTRQEIYDARKLAAAEEKMPGIAERAIAARVAAGLAPTRANLKNAIGTKTATKEERGNNLYETAEEATRAILALEDFTPTVNEPFCGRGAICRMLEAAGYEVVLSDLVDYGTATKDGEVQEVVDFLETTGPAFDIVEPALWRPDERLHRACAARSPARQDGSSAQPQCSGRLRRRRPELLHGDVPAGPDLRDEAPCADDAPRRMGRKQGVEPDEHHVVRLGAAGRRHLWN